MLYHDIFNNEEWKLLVDGVDILRRRCADYGLLGTGTRNPKGFVISNWQSAYMLQVSGKPVEIAGYTFHIFYSEFVTDDIPIMGFSRWEQLEASIDKDTLKDTDTWVTFDNIFIEYRLPEIVTQQFVMHFTQEYRLNILVPPLVIQLGKDTR